MGVHVAGAGLLGAEAGQLHVAANAHADDHGRAGACPGMAHDVQHGALHALDAVGRHEHAQAALVLAARALGGEAQFDAVAGHELRVDDGRGVVAGIFALEERLFHGGLAQIAFGVALGDARVHGVFEEAAGDVHFLPYLGEDHGKAGVLTDGTGLGSRDVGVFQKLAEHVAPGGRRLAFLRAAHGFEHGLGHAAAGLDGEGGHSVAYGFEGYLSHGGSFA